MGTLLIKVPLHLQDMAPGTITIITIILRTILCQEALLMLSDLLDMITVVVMLLPSAPAPIHGTRGTNFKDFLELPPPPSKGRMGMESPLRITHPVCRSCLQGWQEAGSRS